MDRHIPLNGSRNFRDFGGCPTRTGGSVKRGVLYRSDSLSTLDPDDIYKLDPLGIRTVCDLRRSQERESHPSRWPDKNNTSFHHLPLFLDSAPGSTGSIMADAKKLNSEASSRQIMIDIYKRMVSDPHALSRIRQVFELIASPNATPILIHCSGGKDRTGVCCALILTLLEVDEEAVMEDYMNSLHLYTHRVDITASNLPQVYDTKEIDRAPDSVLRPIYSVDPSYLASAFESIAKTYGTTDSFFLNALSLTESQIKSIRNRLVE